MDHHLDLITQRFRGALVGMLASWGATPRDAIELAQDTFAEAYLSRERFRGDWDDISAVGKWLRGIAKNLYLAHLRRWARRAETLEEQDHPATEPVQESEHVIRIRAAMDRLRGPWRCVLQMHYVEGSGLAEIAALLGISERSVEGRLRRARQELERVLKSDPLIRSQSNARMVEEQA